MNNKPLYADVILPLSVSSTYTYGVPDEFTDRIKEGIRVIVQFGAKRLYSALVKRLHNNKPSARNLKEIVDIMDDIPILQPHHLKLWDWISSYYMCNTGDVFKAALPAGLRIESETKIFINDDYNSSDNITNEEGFVMRILEKRKEISANELSSISKKKNVLPLIKTLAEKNAIIVGENISGNYKPRKKAYVTLNSEYNTEDKLHLLLDELSQAPKQRALVNHYIRLSGSFFEKNKTTAELPKSEFLSEPKNSPQSFNALVKKKVFEVFYKEISRLDMDEATISAPVKLNQLQQQAFEKIKQELKLNRNVLLHGVTSSGKTEIYIHLIDEMIKLGKQVLYLLPEIALTTQMITRLKHVFGSKICVYHSRYSDAERVEIWKNLSQAKKPFDIVLGARSSVFLPFRNLGLVIIDEEHENSYKQFDPAPRYNARDTSIMLAHLCNANVLLGTATPSLESYYNAVSGKYSIVNLEERFSGIELPEIQIADVKRAYKKKQMTSHYTPLLMEEITRTLEMDKQVILFQNRRGFSPFLECETCNWIPKCKYCDVSLTYHKYFNKMVCHYCSWSISIPGKCGSCSSERIKTRGFGTEKIEDEIKILFPETIVARLDLDAAKTRKSFERIISDFEIGKTKILVGTQMISKGLDFQNVRLVGILNADNMLHFPDFRAYERSFQLMAQVSGRAGRKDNRGMVVIQTSNHEHPIIKDVLNHDFDHFIKTEMKERRTFKYPPFYRLIKITLKHVDARLVHQSTTELANSLRNDLANLAIVLGPDIPLVSRIKNRYLKNIMVKIGKEQSLSFIKDKLQNRIGQFSATSGYKAVQVVIDVDPY